MYTSASISHSSVSEHISFPPSIISSDFALAKAAQVVGASWIWSAKLLSLTRYYEIRINSYVVQLRFQWTSVRFDIYLSSNHKKRLLSQLTLFTSKNPFSLQDLSTLTYACLMMSIFEQLSSLSCSIVEFFSFFSTYKYLAEIITGGMLPLEFSCHWRLKVCRAKRSYRTHLNITLKHYLVDLVCVLIHRNDGINTLVARTSLLGDYLKGLSYYVWAAPVRLVWLLRAWKWMHLIESASRVLFHAPYVLVCECAESGKVRRLSRFS